MELAVRICTLRHPRDAFTNGTPFVCLTRDTPAWSQVGRSEAPPGVGLAIPRIHDLPKVVPKLFESRIEDPDPGVLPSSPCAIALMAPSSS